MEEMKGSVQSMVSKLPSPGFIDSNQRGEAHAKRPGNVELGHAWAMRAVDELAVFLG